MYKTIFLTHLICVNAFLLIYVVKTILLLANNEAALIKFTKMVKVLEMILSALFLLTGIYMLTQLPAVNTLLIIKIIAVLASIPLAIVGFKKKNKALAVVSLLLIIAAYGLAEMSKKHGGKQELPIEPGAERVAGIVDGQAVFQANCISCHGADGKLGLMDSPDLSTSAMDVNAKLVIVKDGKGAMQPFEGRLTEEEIIAVVTYTETLKK